MAHVNEMVVFAASVTTFANAQNQSSGLQHATAIVKLDINADGKPDLAIAGHTSTPTGVFPIRNGTNVGSPVFSFSVGNVLPTAVRPTSVAMGDLDGDGKPDLAASSSNGNLVSCFANTTVPGSATPVFRAPVEIDTQSRVPVVALADLNSDGRLDIVGTWEAVVVRPKHSSTGRTARVPARVQSLAARLERVGALSPGAAVGILRQIAAAVGAAHRVQIIHRDLKPEIVS